MAVEAMGVRAQTENIPVSQTSKSQSLHLQIKKNVHTLFICFITRASVAFCNMNPALERLKNKKELCFLAEFSYVFQTFICSQRELHGRRVDLLRFADLDMPTLIVIT